MAVPSEDGPPDHGLLADPGSGPQDRALNGGVLLDVALTADDAVGTDARAGLHDGALVNEARPLDRGAFLNACARRHESRARRVQERPGLAATVHDVAVHLRVLLGRADVDPVAAIDIGDESFTALDERGEETPLDRPRLTLGNPVERVGLEHVDAGVDRVARD